MMSVKATKKPIDWDAQPLGELFDSDLAAKLGCSKQRVHQVRKSRGISALGVDARLPDDLPYGKVSDVEIAKSIHVSVATVQAKRKSLGIPTWRSTNAPRWAEKALPLLGTMPDASVASIAGTTQSSVCRFRKKLGIASWADKAWGSVIRGRRRKLRRYSHREIVSLIRRLDKQCWGGEIGHVTAEDQQMIAEIAKQFDPEANP